MTTIENPNLQSNTQDMSQTYKENLTNIKSLSTFDSLSNYACSYKELRYKSMQENMTTLKIRMSADLETTLKEITNPELTPGMMIQIS